MLSHIILHLNGRCTISPIFWMRNLRLRILEQLSCHYCFTEWQRERTGEESQMRLSPKIVALYSPLDSFSVSEASMLCQKCQDPKFILNMT